MFELAEAEKNKGNCPFIRGDFVEAVKLYEYAIDVTLFPDIQTFNLMFLRATCFSNLATSYLMLFARRDVSVKLCRMPERFGK
jgi:hypothetical protein